MKVSEEMIKAAYNKKPADFANKFKSAVKEKIENSIKEKISIEKGKSDETN